MVSDAAASARRPGSWAAALCAFFSLFYVVAQLFEWSGALGSAGGAESTSTPFGLAVLLTPSLLLGSAFLVLMVCLHQRTTPSRRLWSHAGVAFATAYAVLTGMVYFVQLTVVGPRLARGEIGGMEMFVFVPFDSFLYAVDILGYTFMSVAALFAAFALEGGGGDPDEAAGPERPVERGARPAERIARRLLLATALLIPFLVFQMYWHDLIWVASLWAVTFPGAMIALAATFRADGPAPASSPSAAPPPRPTACSR